MLILFFKEIQFEIQFEQRICCWLLGELISQKLLLCPAICALDPPDPSGLPVYLSCQSSLSWKRWWGEPHPHHTHHMTWPGIRPDISKTPDTRHQQTHLDRQTSFFYQTQTRQNHPISDQNWINPTKLNHIHDHAKPACVLCKTKWLIWINHTKLNQTEPNWTKLNYTKPACVKPFWWYEVSNC